MTDKSAEYRVIINEGTAEIFFYRQKRDLSRFFRDEGDGGSIDGEILDSLIQKTKEKLSGKAEITGWSAADEIVISLDISKNGPKSADEFIEAFLDSMAEYYEENEMHVTRMFGSYVHLKRESGELRAVKATPIPIRYCPLMTNLLTEVGGETAVSLLKSVSDEDISVQTEMMCRLINDVVIKGGYFDTSRPLNSCEANVLFGASETMSTAFRSGLLDAAVIVSNNLGTIITTNDSNTQGAVKRMTGLFLTSPAKEIMNTAYEASIIPVFPHSAAIDQTAEIGRAHV